MLKSHITDFSAPDKWLLHFDLDYIACASSWFSCFTDVYQTRLNYTQKILIILQLQLHRLFRIILSLSSGHKLIAAGALEKLQLQTTNFWTMTTKVQDLSRWCPRSLSFDESSAECTQCGECLRRGWNWPPGVTRGQCLGVEPKTMGFNPPQPPGISNTGWEA